LGTAGTSPKNVDGAAADTKQEIEVLDNYSKQTEEEGTQTRSSLFRNFVSVVTAKTIMQIYYRLGGVAALNGTGRALARRDCNRCGGLKEEFVSM
jgi:hypothetical protein